MKTLLFASALLLSAAGADGSAGGSPNEPDPNLNDAGEKREDRDQVLIHGGNQGLVNLSELDADFQARLAAERAEFDKIRALTPTQEVELKTCPGSSHLGVIIGTPDGIRCISLADWRTDRICLKAGDHAQILVLAGEGLKTWEFYREQENREKDAGGVKTAALNPAAAAALVNGLAAGAAPDRADVQHPELGLVVGGFDKMDPLEETQPAIPGTNEAEGGTKAANAETTTAQGS